MREAGFGTAYLIDAEGLLSKQVTIFADYIKLDVLTSRPCIEFVAALKRRKVIAIEGFQVKFIALDDLIVAKQEAGQRKDLEDVAVLELIRQQFARHCRK